jgi:hypothetical protein
VIKEFLRARLSLRQRFILRNLRNDLRSVFYGNDLDALARIYGTDKAGRHFYMAHYKSHLKKFKYKGINLLEIGVGGYKNPTYGGHSLRMWKRYFPFGRIFSIDIHDKSFLQERRVRIFRGSQVDKIFLDNVLHEMGEVDIIIDDGSHINEHIIETFKLLFPKLKDGGVYVVEDTQTSYWDEYGGDSLDLNNPRTALNFFKRLTDGLNNKEFINPGYKQTYFDKKIVSMHFYHNLVFIYKGNNDEESNIVVNNSIPPEGF